MENLYNKLNKFKSTYPLILPTSSFTGLGIDEFRANVLACSSLLEFNLIIKTRQEKLRFLKEQKLISEAAAREVEKNKYFYDFKVNRKKKVEFIKPKNRILINNEINYYKKYGEDYINNPLKYINNLHVDDENKEDNKEETVLNNNKIIHGLESFNNKQTINK
jgi:hypothetical protein